MNKKLPSLIVIEGISWLYDNASLARLISWLAGKTRDATGWGPVFTDFLVGARLLWGIIFLFSPFYAALIVFAGLLLYDVLIAHAAHLFNPNVGSGGAGKRIAAARSLLIALINVGVIVVLFATITRQLEKCSSLHALAVSASTITTLGLQQPSTVATQALALIEGMITLFMIAVVLSTVLSGLPARKEVSPTE
jgi:hypothetical protein